jgi:glycosyltransferase involved in cell wall biosynthesis
MKLLVLTFYYTPDLSAGSFRATALVRALSARLGASDQIDVVTTQPNRYSSFRAAVASDERIGNVRVRRIALPAHESGMADQSRAFWAFQRAARRLIAGEHYDVVFATSSRLFTAVLGSWVARRRNIPLYLDIRDIFVDTIKDVLAGTPGKLARVAFSGLEKYAIERAEKVNLVSKGFGPYFNERYPQQRYSFFTNGIDDEFLEPSVSSPIPRDAAADAVPQVLYAGNIGEGQGLHSVIPALAAALAGRASFVIVGDGGRRGALEERLASLGVTNVQVLPPMNRAQLIAAYRAADVLFLHLNDFDAFRKVLPSKIFEYAATGKPIWAGVAGYAAEFLREHVTNATVFAPCDVTTATQQFDTLDLRWQPRHSFVRQFSRETISEALAADLLRLAPRGG